VRRLRSCLHIQIVTTQLVKISNEDFNCGPIQKKPLDYLSLALSPCPVLVLCCTLSYRHERRFVLLFPQSSSARICTHGFTDYNLPTYLECAYVCTGINFSARMSLFHGCSISLPSSLMFLRYLRSSMEEFELQSPSIFILVVTTRAS
jgi:hypothetical protein